MVSGPIIGLAHTVVTWHGDPIFRIQRLVRGPRVFGTRVRGLDHNAHDMPYDFIVVGGGSARSVVAARLSKDPDAQVLLLDARPADGPEAVSVPPAWPTLIGSELDWGMRPRRLGGGRRAGMGLSRFREDPHSRAFSGENGMQRLRHVLVLALGRRCDDRRQTIHDRGDHMLRSGLGDRSALDSAAILVAESENPALRSRIQELRTTVAA